MMQRVARRYTLPKGLYPMGRFTNLLDDKYSDTWFFHAFEDEQVSQCFSTRSEAEYEWHHGSIEWFHASTQGLAPLQPHWKPYADGDELDFGFIQARGDGPALLWRVNEEDWLIIDAEGITVTINAVAGRDMDGTALDTSETYVFYDRVRPTRKLMEHVSILVKGRCIITGERCLECRFVAATFEEAQ